MSYDPRYAKRWRLDRERGHTRWTDPIRAERHIASLLAAGASRRAIADAAGMSVAGVARIARGEQKHIKRTYEAKILAVTVAQLTTRDHPDKFVPDLGARRRIRALMTLGHTHADIAQAAGWGRNGTTVANVLHQKGSWITKAKHDALVVAYRALCTTPGTSSRTRISAEKRGYPGPLAWDDIDDPYAEPDLDAGEQEDGRQGIDADEVAWLLDQQVWTWDGIEARLGVTHTALNRALYRAGRDDLVARLTTNTRGIAA